MYTFLINKESYEGSLLLITKSLHISINFIDPLLSSSPLFGLY